MKKYVKVVVFGILVFINVGCVSKVAPVGDAGFKKIQDIKELNGCYKNVGESGNKRKTDLSYFIWKDKKIEHKNITTMCVSTIDSNSISLIGKDKNNKTLYTQKYSKGNDFTIESGKITLKNKLGVANDNFAGATYESVVIGLDTEGNGRVQRGDTFAGVALLIPIVMHESIIYKFLRL